MKYSKTLVAVFIFASLSSQSQERAADDSKYLHDTVRSTISRFQNLSFGGYIQPQFQVAEDKGIDSYEGGDFQKHANNRFMVRRARLKTEYTIYSKDKVQKKKGLFALQVEATERGVSVIEAFSRWYLLPTLSVSAGFFDHPYGNEVLMSSSSIESPERGRGSQLLLPGEKDLGAMMTLEPGGKLWKYFKIDAGLFNGTSGPRDYDSFKDLNARLRMKPIPVSRNQFISAGVSALYGGWVQENKHRYELAETAGNKFFVSDSNTANIGTKVPREYLGVDAQYLWKHKRGKTELRGEYWNGVQSGSSTSTVSPATLLTSPAYIRNFDAAFFYLVHSILDNKWEAVIKYDWYDPNTEVAEDEITEAGKFTEADIKYNTLGAGITHYITPNLKILGYYSMVKNESTRLPAYTGDIDDNVFTLRLQVKF